MRTNLLLFDLGGVLVENDTFSELATLTDNTFDDHELRDRWLTSPSVRHYERGEIDTERFCQAFVAEWRLGISCADFATRFSRWPKGAYAGADRLIERLRRTHRIAFLSNCNELHWQRLVVVRAWADHAFSSHLTGFLKPDRESFLHVSETLGVPLDQILFFDDSAMNVRAACDLGIAAYQTDGFQELDSVINSLKI